ncbi:MAG: HDIG domain-containing protein [Synechococcales cyanobacterium]
MKATPLLFQTVQAHLQDWQQRLRQWDPIQPPRPTRHKVKFLRSRQVTFYSLALAAMVGVYGIPYYNEPHLSVGSIAPDTVTAPAAAAIPDPVSTEKLRRQAREQTSPVWRIDPDVNRTMEMELRLTFQTVERWRQQVGILPVVSTELLTVPVQAYIRQLSATEWQDLQVLATTSTNETDAVTAATPQLSLALEQLRRLQASPNREAVITTITLAQQRYQRALEEAGPIGIPNAPELLDLTEPQWQRLQQLVERALKRLQALGITAGLPPIVQRQGIQAQLNDLSSQDGFIRPLQATVLTWLDQSLQPNLVIDQEQTRLRSEALAGQVEPVLIDVAAGDILVRENQEITPEIFLVLDYFHLTQRQVNLNSLLGLSGLLLGSLVAFRLVYPRCGVSLRNRDRLLLLLLSLTVPALAIPFGAAFSSLPAIALLVSSYYGRRLGLVIVAGQAVLLPATVPIQLLTYVPVLVGSAVACILAERLRSREELAILGGGAALAQVVVQGVLSLGTGVGLELGLLSLTGGTGLGWTIIALGASPYLERLFDLITPVRLLELANPNRPLLRQMATQAPGTFQHTLFVASLAERAAQRLKDNAELVRTGTLYHDIGKMIHPEYFIENQMGRLNPHDQLDDPYRSTEIIKAHVSDGLKLAQKHQLPSAIQAFIPEHQGTICIAYFFHKAKSRHQPGDPPIVEDDFRYAGPIPQSRETGIVMLADACEAALRSMGSQDCLTVKVTAEARATVERICRSRWQDGQLVDSGLTLADLDTICDTFIEVWQQSHHERIRYPASTEPDVTVGNTTLDLVSPPTPTSEIRQN